MAKTRRVRVKIIKMLQEFGELNTAQIFDKLNEQKGRYGSRHGVPQSTLNNVLGKEPVFVKIIDHSSKLAPQTGNISGSMYSVSLWGLNHPLLNAHPELASTTTNSFRLKASL